MKLHDLTPGQRFSFRDKHRGKVFEVTERNPYVIEYRDVATAQVRYAYSNREMFRKDVMLVSENRVVELTLHEQDMLHWILYGAYTEADSELTRSEINALHCKLTGHPGRRVVLPENDKL